MTDRLYRHPTDRVIAGVAGGLAVWLNIDPSLVRIAWVLLAFFSGGAFILVYIVMMIVVPLPPPGWIPQPRGSAGPGPGAIPGWQPGSSSWDGGWGAGNQAGGWTTPPGGVPPAGAAPGGATGSGPAWGTPPPGGWPAQPAWTPPRPGNAGLVAGVILVGLGLWFLVDQYVRIDWRLIWPVLIMIGGGALIARALMRHDTD